MRNKRITIFTINDVWYDQRMIKIAESFCEKGWEVTWFARRLSESTLDNNFNFNVKRVSFLFKKGVFFYLEYAIKQFWYLLKHRENDVVWCCDPDTLVGVYLVQFFTNQNFIYDSHEFFCETPEFKNKFFRKKIWKKIENWGINHSALNVTVASNLALKLKDIYGKPFSVLMNTPIALPDLPPERRDNIIMYQGVLNAGRGLECAIEAMRLLPDFQLWICGEGDLSEHLRNMAKTLENVYFFGRLSPEILIQKTIKAKFGLNLLDLTSQSYYYSLANKFFDYAACGVVSINSPGIEYLKFESEYQHSLILDYLDPNLLARLIKNTPQVLINKKVAFGFDMVKKNLWNFDALYLEIIKDR